MPLRSGKSLCAPTNKSYGRDARRYSVLQAKKQSAKKELANLETSTGSRSTRKRQKLEAIIDTATPESLAGGIVDTPPSATRRGAVTRGNEQDRPVCTGYGRARHSQFKDSGFYFCASCDDYDTLPPDKRRLVRVGKQECTAKHTCFVFPTHQLVLPADPRNKDTMQRILFKAREVRKRKFKTIADDRMTEEVQEEAMDENAYYSEDPGEQIPLANNPGDVPVLGDALVHMDAVASPAENLTLDSPTSPSSSTSSDKTDLPVQLCNCTQTQELQECKRLNRALKEKIRRLEQKVVELKENQKEKENLLPTVPGESENMRFSRIVENVLLSTIQGDRNFRMWGRLRIGKMLSKIVFSFDSDVCQDALIKHSKLWLWENVFHPLAILKEMDLAGGMLGYEGYEILRTVEKKAEADGKKRYYGLLPSSSELQNWVKKVEDVSTILCGKLQHYQMDHGECIRFEDLKKVLLLIPEAYGLTQIAKQRSMSVSQSMDGANLSKKENHVANGLKNIDIAARCPETGQYLLADPTLGNAQSRNMCHILMMMFCRETKKTVVEFGDVFDFFQRCAMDDPTVNPLMADGFKPITLVISCDMALEWKGLGKGGGYGPTKIRPCHMCCKLGRLWAAPNMTPCTRWCRELHSEKLDFKCYHTELDDEENLQSKRQELERLKSSLEELTEDIIEESEIRKEDDIDNPSATAQRDIRSIHFEPQTTMEQRNYSKFITDELQLRDLDTSGSLERRRRRLRRRVQTERKIPLLIAELEHSEARDGAIFLLMQTVPCVLHKENRVGLKLLTMCLIEGLDNAKSGKLFSEVRSEGKRLEMYIELVESTVNTSIMGSDDNPGQWSVPYDPKEKQITRICMANVKSRIVLSGLNELVNISIVDDERKQRFCRAVDRINSALKKARQKDDFTTEQILSFQNDVDEFAQDWLWLYGNSAMTNYIHQLISGHISYFMFQWKNLYRHSQQGWEALNSLIKTFYFRRTQRGGASNKGKGPKTKLLPIGRWLQRRLLWLCGYNRYKIEEVLATRIHELVVLPAVLFGESADDSDDEDDIHGDILLDDYGII